MSLTAADQKQVIEKAKHYLNLLGTDFESKRNIAAMAMAIGWKMGKSNEAKGFEDCIEVGYKISQTTELVATMVGSATILAMKSETIEEAFLGEEDEAA